MGAATTAVTLGGAAAEHAHVAQSYHYHAGQLPHHDNNNSMMLTELQSAYNQTISVSSSVAPTSNGTTDILTKPDHPGLRGTPLAMLAAQCNKLTTKSPPPLADAAVGKGFHPWKKSPQSSSSPSGGQNPTQNQQGQNQNNPQQVPGSNQQQQQRSSSNTSSQSYSGGQTTVPGSNPQQGGANSGNHGNQQQQHSPASTTSSASTTASAASAAQAAAASYGSGLYFPTSTGAAGSVT